MRPGGAALDEEHEIPGPGAGAPVRAHTTITPACAPLVIHCFCAVEDQPIGRRARGRAHPAGIAAGAGLAEREGAGYDTRPRRARGRTAPLLLGAEPAITSATMLVTAIVTAVDAHAARDLPHRQRRTRRRPPRRHRATPAR